MFKDAETLLLLLGEKAGMREVKKQTTFLPAPSSLAALQNKTARTVKTIRAGLLRAFNARRFEESSTRRLKQFVCISGRHGLFCSGHCAGGAFAETVRADFVSILLRDGRATDDDFYFFTHAGLL